MNFDTRLFLSAHGLDQLVRGVSDLVAKNASSYAAVWDEATQFAVIVEVHDGTPAQWHVRGPFNREAAKHWLGIVQDEIHGWRPPTSTPH